MGAWSANYPSIVYRSYLGETKEKGFHWAGGAGADELVEFYEANLEEMR